jgi:hypothetical protein
MGKLVIFCFSALVIAHVPVRGVLILLAHAHLNQLKLPIAFYQPFHDAWITCVLF